MPILEDGLGFFNSLDGYINNAFEQSKTYKPRIEEAGKKYFKNALNENWESANRLFVSAGNFIAKYNAQLTSNGGMPPAFKANFKAKIEEYNTTYKLFKESLDNAKIETEAKINANNLIYKKGRQMMEDGKHIFRKNPAVRELFTWENILATISTHRNPVDPPEPTEPPIE